MDEAAFWKVTCSSPSGVPDWDNSDRVTVIGNAVHSVTPAGGLGANTAVRDSELLGRLLREAGGCRTGLTAEYEKQMRIYGSEAVKMSYKMAQGAFGPQSTKRRLQLSSASSTCTRRRLVLVLESVPTIWSPLVLVRAHLHNPRTGLTWLLFYVWFGLLEKCQAPGWTTIVGDYLATPLHAIKVFKVAHRHC